VLVVVPVVPVVVPVEPVVPVVVPVVLVPVVPVVPVVLVPVVPVVLVPVVPVVPVVVPVVPVVLVPVVACPHAGNANTNRKVRATNIVLMNDGTDFPLLVINLTNSLTLAYLCKQCNDLAKREVASSPSAAKGIRTFDNTSTTTSVTLNFGERLSEKGYERRSDGRFFGRYTGGGTDRQVPLWLLAGLHSGASETFGRCQ
jgi:hypothetical protein